MQHTDDRIHAAGARTDALVGIVQVGEAQVGTGQFGIAQIGLILFHQKLRPKARFPKFCATPAPGDLMGVSLCEDVKILS